MRIASTRTMIGAAVERMPSARPEMMLVAEPVRLSLETSCAGFFSAEV